jgi:hypothetical protein
VAYRADYFDVLHMHFRVRGHRQILLSVAVGWGRGYERDFELYEGMNEIFFSERDFEPGFFTLLRKLYQEVCSLAQVCTKKNVLV